MALTSFKNKREGGNKEFMKDTEHEKKVEWNYRENEVNVSKIMEK